MRLRDRGARELIACATPRRSARLLASNNLNLTINPKPYSPLRSSLPQSPPQQAPRQHRSIICLLMCMSRAFTSAALGSARLQNQLSLLHGQLITILTAGVEKALLKSPKFDIRHLLGGTDPVFASLIRAFTWARLSPGRFRTCAREPACSLRGPSASTSRYSAARLSAGACRHVPPGRRTPLHSCTHSHHCRCRPPPAAAPTWRFKQPSPCRRARPASPPLWRLARCLVFRVTPNPKH